MNEFITTFISYATNDNVNIHNIGYKIFKRLFDIAVSLIGLLLLIPLTIIIKIAYMLSGDFTKVIFTQDRIGLNGKHFKFYKFRSMVPNADEALKKLLAENEDLRKEYEINKKLKNDPRITKVGKLIRHASIDEIPQFINILKGDMSLIGNRPYLPREKDDMGMYYNHIVKTKPGLTGYWQTSGRSNTTFEKRLGLESHYSNNQTLKLDVKIFFKTFSVVLFGRGAE